MDNSKSFDMDALAVPKHKRLQLFLESEIRRGRYRAGERIPTEKELMEEHALSHTTVTRALRELARAGVVARRRRHGTFVTTDACTRLSQTPQMGIRPSLAFFRGGSPEGFHPYFTTLIEGAVSAASERGYDVKFLRLDRSTFVDGLGAQDTLGRMGVSGFIMLEATKPQLKAILAERLPCVMLGPLWLSMPVDRVLIDAAHGFRQALAHFRDQGHRKIVLIDSHPRMEVREIAADVFHCVPSESPVQEVYARAFDEPGAARVLKALDEFDARPTAAFVGDDMLLMHLMRMMTERGIKAPDDLALIGCGTPWSTSLLGSRISLVEVNPHDIASAGVRLVLEQIENHREAGESVWIRPRLVLRETA
jgi:DNA-binding LacI/PurR family transcriptional regulator